MISKDTTKLLTEREPAPFASVLGCRIRRLKQVNEAVLAREGGYRQVEVNPEAKKVLDERR
jgi:hypothetical protein